jgi:hypothetical protein
MTKKYKLAVEKKSLAELKFNIESFSFAFGHGDQYEDVQPLFEIGITISLYDYLEIGITILK